MPADTHPLRSTVLGRYRLRYLVAHGGMASVYLGQVTTSPNDEKWVAVKVLHPHLAQTASVVEMFFDEARVAGRLQHPNVCVVLDSGNAPENELPYLVMEYLHGETLAVVQERARAEQKRIPFWLSARVVADAARGLHAAHELRREDGRHIGIVHRDVSPQNIVVLYDGLTKVLDFGVAKLRNEARQTVAGELKGKLNYMAPEQLQRKPIDQRTDLWSLGVVLWEAMVGEPLFESDNEAAILYDILMTPIAKPSSIVEGVPPKLEEAVLAALQRNPDHRPASAAEFADLLEAYLEEASPPAGRAQVGQWMKDNLSRRFAARESLLRHVPATLVTVVFDEEDREPLPEAQRDDEGALSQPTEDSSLGPNPLAVTGQSLETAGWPSLPQSVRDRSKRALMVGALLSTAGLTILAGTVAAVGLSHFSSSARVDTTQPAPLPARDSRAVPDGGRADGGAAAPPPVLASARAPTADAGSGLVQAPSALSGARDASPPSNAPSASPPVTREVATPAKVGAPSVARVSSHATEAESHQAKKQLPRSEPGKAPGKLNLLAIPSAEVFLGSRSLGKTPLFNFPLPSGTHRLVLRPVAGGRPRQLTVTVPPGETVRHSVRLQK